MAPGIPTDPQQGFRGCADTREVLAGHHRWYAVVPEQERFGKAQLCSAERRKGTEEEYIEYYHYVLEAKIVLHEKIQVSILTREFIENENREVDNRIVSRKGRNG